MRSHVCGLQILNAILIPLKHHSWVGSNNRQVLRLSIVLHNHFEILAPFGTDGVLAGGRWSLQEGRLRVGVHGDARVWARSEAVAVVLGDPDPHVGPGPPPGQGDGKEGVRDHHGAHVEPQPVFAHGDGRHGDTKVVPPAVRPEVGDLARARAGGGVARPVAAAPEPIAAGALFAGAPGVAVRAQVPGLAFGAAALRLEAVVHALAAGHPALVLDTLALQAANTFGRAMPRARGVFDDAAGGALCVLRGDDKDTPHDSRERHARQRSVQRCLPILVAGVLDVAGDDGANVGRRGARRAGVDGNAASHARLQPRQVAHGGNSQRGQLLGHLDPALDHQVAHGPIVRVHRQNGPP
mmetsp:Transcript_133960/g.232525  ORF Transcript_133960/g.232525 Transcript_133960/m.232525 type:complete len:353 (+) Transcript_133960:526-1584(+)